MEVKPQGKTLEWRGACRFSGLFAWPPAAAGGGGGGDGDFAVVGGAGEFGDEGGEGNRGAGAEGSGLRLQRVDQ